MNYTQLIVDRVKDFRIKLVETNKFFKALRAGELENMEWVRQLWFQSDGYTRALSLRSALCEDARFKEVFAQHAREEILHPFQLLRWMEKEGFDITRFGTPTPETKACITLCKNAATELSPELQVLILNVLMEGAGLTFYTEVIKEVSKRRPGKFHGPYWHIHQEVDDIHMGLGVPLIGELSPQQFEVACTIIDASCLIVDGMIASWA